MFYFEIRIESDVDHLEDVNGLLVAVGLFPGDQLLQGIPGIHCGSYGFLRYENYQLYLSGTAMAQDVTTNRTMPNLMGALSSEQRYKVSLKPLIRPNDVVGCGWNPNEGTVFFTKNGKYLGTAFKNVYGTFYPAIGVQLLDSKLLTSSQLDGVTSDVVTSISVNFGQIPFLFEINELLATVDDPEHRSGKTGQRAFSFASGIADNEKLNPKQKASCWFDIC